MEKASIASGSKSVQKRLAPLKVTIGLLYRELDAAKGDRAVAIDRMLLESVISTLELFVDDVDEGKSRDVEERKFVEAQPRPAAVPRV
ncbi:MAG: hypothetical protein U1E76_20630 [Planctomycetota bacterium]